MQKSIELDGTNFPRGYHWFWGLYFLHENVTKFPKINLKALQNKSPDEHWLRKIEADETGFIPDSEIDEIPPSAIQNNKLCILHDYLNEIEYPKDIDFSGLLFKKKTNFSNLIFPIDTDFSNSKFLKDVLLNDTKFLSKADFSNTAFSQDVLFNDAIFFETADFEDATFQSKDSYRKETAKFRNTIFKKIANFRNATFWGYANFKGAKLAGRAFFQKAQFECHAPRFYDATFNNEMTWAGIKLPKFAEAKVDRYTKVDDEFKPVKCGECTDCAKCVERDKCIKHAKCVRCKKLIEENRTRRIEENQNSYENTAILLAGQNKYHDQHFFFREEMRCRRELEGDTLIRWAFGLYEGLTDYGYGIERAFKAWAWHIVFGIIAIATTASCAGVGLQENLFCSISTSIANANPFVFVIIKDGSLMECYKELNMRSPMMFGAIRGFQTFIGVTLLFLLLTTLRIRFRLK